VLGERKVTQDPEAAGGTVARKESQGSKDFQETRESPDRRVSPETEDQEGRGAETEILVLKEILVSPSVMS